MFRPFAFAAAFSGIATVTETIDEVEWEGGTLPDTLYDSFGMLMTLPNAAGNSLYFPAVQVCQEGSRHWAEIPAAGQRERDLRDPAPFVRLTPEAP